MKAKLVVALAVAATIALVVGMFLHEATDADVRRLLAAAAIATATVAYLGAAVVRRRAKKSGPLDAVAIALYSLVVVGLAAELRFASIDRSHSVNYNLAGRLWLKRHYRYNSYKARADEPDPRALDAKKRIIVVGDSFAAGHGVEERERFSDLLAERVPPDHVVVNTAVSGLDSRALYEKLVAFPWRPHVLVLSYFGNDVSEAAVELGYALPAMEPYGDLSPAVRWVVTRSYALDHFYWSRPRGDLVGWWSFFDRAWSDPRVVALHEKDLDKFVAFARSNHCPLIVTLFPFLHDARVSALYVPKVRAFFESRGVPTIDVGKLIEDVPFTERIASVNDVHPSPRIHRIVADALAARLPELIAAEGR